MTTKDKCEAILKWVVANLDDDRENKKRVAFERNWGGNTLTVFCGRSHTHYGKPCGEWKELVDELYSALHGGPGLSWE